MIESYGFFAPGIVTGTIVFGVLGVIASFVAPSMFAKESKNITRSEAVRLTLVIVWMTTVCMYLFWLWTYMHQMVPLIRPVHNIEH
jgi:heme/copper-type cytochrome/quinol oxidase subunit 2